MSDNGEDEEKIPTVEDWEQLNKRLTELLRVDIYKRMRFSWLKVGMLLIVGNIIGILLWWLFQSDPPMIILPDSPLSVLSFPDVFLALFAGTISVSSIVIGFSAAFSIFFLKLHEARFSTLLDELAEAESELTSRIKKILTSDGKPLTRYEKASHRHRIIEFKWVVHIRFAVSKYTRIFIATSSCLLAMQIIVFLFSAVSGWISVIALVMCIDTLVIVLGGFFPLIRVALLRGEIGG